MPLLRAISNRPWILAVLIGLGAVAWMASGIVGGDPPAESAADSDARDAGATEVQVRRQHAEAVTREVVVYGRTAPARIVQVAAETRGRVVAIGAERGERVKEGAVLVRLDARDREVRLTETRALLKQREIEFQARQRLQGEGYVSETQLAEAEAQLEQARAELQRAQLDLEYMVIRAPFDGAILERDVEVGDFLDPGDPVLTFVDNRTLIVTASIAEQDIAAVEEGQRGKAELITGQEVQGRLRYVSPVADTSTRTFTVEMALDNESGRLPSGVTAELHLPVGEVMAQKVSPALLTLAEDGTLGLKLVGDDGEVHFVPTEIVKATPEGVWLSGLPEEATVITVGQGFVRDGERVVAVAEQARPASITAEAGE